MDSKELRGLYEAYNEVYQLKEYNEDYKPWDFGPKDKARKKYTELSARKKAGGSAPRTATRANRIASVGSEMRTTLDKDSAMTMTDPKKQGLQPSTQRHTLAAMRGAGGGMTARTKFRKEEFELWVNDLLDEGYDLSDYTWDEMYESYLDEGLGSAIKRIFSGKKEAEAPKPESRGAELRRRYNVGPEGSDTSPKRKILNRAKDNAERAQKQVDMGNASQSYASNAKDAHNKYLKAGYSKYGADLPPVGRGNKARKRAAALNAEDFEFIVNALIEEGYDLSSYTWDEMYEVCLDEAVKGASRHDTEMRKAASTERRAGVKNLLTPAAGKDNADKMQRDVNYFDKLTKKNRNVVGLVTKEEVEGLDESGLPQDTIQRAVKLRQKRVDDAYAKDTPEGDAEGKAGMRKLRRSKSQLDINKPREVRMRANEEVDIFDAILEYLVAEGYADTNESALVIMANMSEEWRQSIVEVKMDPRGRPASGPMNVYKQSKPNNDPAFQAALKSVRDADAKKTPEQRKAELDAYKERQMNR